MTFNTLKGLIGKSKLETADGDSFKFASIYNINQAMNELNKDNKYQVDVTEESTREFAEKVSDAGAIQIQIIGAINKIHNTKVDVLKVKPSEFISIGKNPSTQELAKYYLLTSYIDDALSKKNIEKTEKLEEILNNVKDEKAFKEKVDNLSANPVFKKFAAKHTDDLYSEWKGVNKRATGYVDIYKEKLDEYSKPSLGDTVINGAEYRGSTNIEHQYNRFVSVMEAKILSNPKNFVLFQGITAGQYNNGAITDIISDALRENNVLTEELRSNPKLLNDEITSGRVEKKIYDNLLKNKMSNEAVRDVVENVSQKSNNIQDSGPKLGK